MRTCAMSIKIHSQLLKKINLQIKIKMAISNLIACEDFIKR